MTNSQSLPEISTGNKPNDNQEYRDNLKKAKQFLRFEDGTVDDQKILNVYKRLKEFVQYFVNEFETKLDAYFMVVEKCKEKPGKYADTFAAELGQGGGAIVGFLLGLLAGQSLAGAKYGADLGKLGGKKLGQKLGTERHEENVAKAMDLVLMYNDNKAAMRRLLVEVGIDIFQSFEMQFTHVQAKELGPTQAMLLFARDAVNRAVNLFSVNHEYSISECVILGQSKRGLLGIIKSPGFDVLYASEHEWKTASLYGKAGLIRRENDRIQCYKNKDSRTDKYGYRRNLQSENIKKLYDEYDIDHTDETKTCQFTSYKYILDLENAKEILGDLLKEINLVDEDLSEERLKYLVEDSKAQILSCITEQTHHIVDNKELLLKIESNIKSLNITEYRAEFKSFQKDTMEYLERAEGERRAYAEADRAGHKKTQSGIEDNSRTVNKIYEQNVQQTELINKSIAANRKIHQKVSKKWEGVFGISRTVRFFTGRGQQLQEIADNIQKGVVVVCGLSGIGKSELAVKYAGSPYNEGNSVVWVDATTRHTAQNSLHTLAKDKLRMRIKDRDGEYKSLRSIVEEVYEYFSNGRCLFIFDNAEKYSSLEELLPLGLRQDPSKYFILITSHNNLEWQGELIRIIVLPPLNGFTKMEATDFVKKTIEINLEDDVDDERIGRLAAKLHNFPLFLKHVAEYIKIDIVERKRRDSKFNALEYITLLDVENKTDVEIVSKIWQVTFEKVEGEVLGVKAIRMVQLMGYFESNNIPEELFSHNLTDGNMEEIYGVTRSLEKYCILSLNEGMLSIHGLIQEAIRLKEQQGEEGILENGLELFKDRMASDKSIKGYIPHIVSLWNYARKYDGLIKRFIVDDDSTSTYFRLIAESSSDDVVKALLDKIGKQHPDKLPGVINAVGRKRKTALHYAIRGGNLHTIKLLIHKGANVDARDASSHRPLHLAARYGLNVVVKALLEGHADVNAETSDKYKFTPLHLAAQNGHKEVSNVLLKEGARVNARTQYKFTSLQLASENGHLDVVNVLLDQCDIDIENKNGYELTALHLAAQNGHVGVVKALLYKNADMNAFDRGNFTPLHLAAQKGYVKVVNELLSCNKVKVDAETTQGNTPLHLAAENDHMAVVRTLIGNNAKCHIPNKKGRTAHDLAVEKGFANEIKLNISADGSEKQESSFDKTATSLDGQIYEIRLLEWLLLNGLSEDVYSFNLASNMEEAHKLDDIVFKCRYAREQSAKLIFLQAKHRSDPKESESGKITEKNKVTINQLFPRSDAKKADFGLVKYFDSYLKIRQQFSERKISDPIFGNTYKDLDCDVVIYTNAEAAFTEGGIEDVKEGMEKVAVEHDHILNFSKTGAPQSYFYYKILRGKSQKLDEKIDILKDVSGNEEDITEFLSKLKLFIGQPHQNELGKIIKEKIQRDYRVEDQSIDSVFSEFELRVLTWWNEENEYLTKATRFLHDAIRIAFKFNVKEPIVLFTGREKELSELHRALQEEGKVVLTQAISLNGLGGVGKTQLFRQYVNYYSQEYDQNILCVDATNNLTLEESFRILATDVMKIKNNNRDIKDSSLDKIISEVYKFFTERNRKSLFIFDNATAYKETHGAIDSVDLGKFLPSYDDLTPVYDKPHILIISRDRDWGEIAPLSLDVFTETDAIKFINKSMTYEHQQNWNEVCNLAQQMKCFPLALQNALAYIKQENKASKLWAPTSLTITDYLKVYEKKFAPQSNVVSQAIFTTWAVTIDRIKKKRDGKAAVRILNAMGYLAADDVHMDSIFGKLIEDRHELHGAVELLSRYALLNLQHGILEIHRFVQEIVRMRLEEQGLEEVTARVTYNLLANSFPPAELELYIRKNNLLKNFQSCHIQKENEGQS